MTFPGCLLQVKLSIYDLILRGNQLNFISGFNPNNGNPEVGRNSPNNVIRLAPSLAVKRILKNKRGSLTHANTFSKFGKNYCKLLRGKESICFLIKLSITTSDLAIYKI